jgi:hypothetical protein
MQISEFVAADVRRRTIAIVWLLRSIHPRRGLLQHSSNHPVIHQSKAPIGTRTACPPISAQERIRATREGPEGRTGSSPGANRSLVFCRPPGNASAPGPHSRAFLSFRHSSKNPSIHSSINLPLERRLVCPCNGAFNVRNLRYGRVPLFATMVLLRCAHVSPFLT